jgi:predicted GIY-YIG superfamily endonuclease
MDSWRWYIYILECGNGTYYTGMSRDPYSRFEQHKQGVGGKYTSKHGVVGKLLYIEEYENYDEARQREKQIKDWSKKKKEKLIKGEWEVWG